MIEDDPVELIGYANNLALPGFSRISLNKDPGNIQTRWHLLALIITTVPDLIEIAAIGLNAIEENPHPPTAQIIEGDLNRARRTQREQIVLNSRLVVDPVAIGSKGIRPHQHFAQELPLEHAGTKHRRTREGILVAHP
jgi:hypothetical protein